VILMLLSGDIADAWSAFKGADDWVANLLGWVMVAYTCSRCGAYSIKRGCGPS